MPEAVVHRLEMVDVDDRDGHGLGLVGPELLLQEVHGIAAVAQAGQLVAEGGLHGLVALLPQVAQFDPQFGDIGDHAQHPAPGSVVSVVSTQRPSFRLVSMVR